MNEPIVKCERCGRGKDDAIHTQPNYENPAGQISHSFVTPTIPDIAAELHRRAKGDPFALMDILRNRL